VSIDHRTGAVRVHQTVAASELVHKEIKRNSRQSHWEVLIPTMRARDISDKAPPFFSGGNSQVSRENLVLLQRHRNCWFSKRPSQIDHLSSWKHNPALPTSFEQASKWGSACWTFPQRPSPDTH